MVDIELEHRILRLIDYDSFLLSNAFIGDSLFPLAALTHALVASRARAARFRMEQAAYVETWASACKPARNISLLRKLTTYAGLETPSGTFVTYAFVSHPPALDGRKYG